MKSHEFVTRTGNGSAEKEVSQAQSATEFVEVLPLESTHEDDTSNSEYLDVNFLDITSDGETEPHMKLRSIKIVFMCDFCPKICIDKSSLRRHRVSHTGERPYTCTLCFKRFGFRTGLKRHMTVHDLALRAYSCVDCGKKFPDKSGLLKHELLHSGKKSHVCPMCAKAFYHIGDLNLHMKSHNPFKAFKCESCGKSFSRKSNLDRHLHIHGGPSNHKCDVCGVCFHHLSSLTRHIVAFHPTKIELKRTMMGTEPNNIDILNSQC